MEEMKYDIGLVGVWYGWNYGSVLTNYALYSYLQSLGLNTLMIEKPCQKKGSNDIELNSKLHSRAFALKHYADHISQPRMPEEMYQLNEFVDTFMTGSDQLWHYHIEKFSKGAFLLNFVNDSHKRIAYSTSFGHSKDFTPTEDFDRRKNLFKKFNAISVRESSGIDILKTYGVNATQVIDPVFLADKELYEGLAQESGLDIKKPYLLAYILDPTTEKIDAINTIASRLNLNIKIILDGNPSVYNKFKDSVGPDVVLMPSVEEWVYYFRNSSFVITDSYHGTCFSIIFEKKFIVFANKSRGIARFETLFKIIGNKGRMFLNYKQAAQSPIIYRAIDYDAVAQRIEPVLKHSTEWLQNALSLSVDQKITLLKTTEKVKIQEKKEMEKENLDFRHCRMVAVYLKAYGIRHVVLSSGTRHIELARFFEHNDYFIIHNDIDERSAGFYAIGLATTLKQPVAVCCTSGTASSNYLTSVSEAFYQHVPIIYITADRYPYLLNQREAQMVPQESIYKDVCLKEVSLPLVDNWAADRVAKRMICETILEATHRTPGPVHINVPIMNFVRTVTDYSKYDINNITANPVKRYYLTPHDRDTWKPALDRLTNSKGTLIIYGQAQPLTKDQQERIEVFCKKFNCVFLTERIANFSCSKSVDSYLIPLTDINKSELSKLEDIKPDLVITINGAVSSGIFNFVNKYRPAHWEINESGAVADPFKSIKSVFECSADNFIRRMNSLVGNITGGDSYYKAWKKYEKENVADPKNLQDYSISKVVTGIPSGSLLHIANSNAIRMASKYKTKDNVEVFCNRGTNGIDGSMSSFFGQAAVNDTFSYLIIGDLSFFYDMNSLWAKGMSNKVRIMLCNNSCAGLLAHHQSPSITYKHNATAKGWVQSMGFKYLSASSAEELDNNLQEFLSDEDKLIFLEVFC